MRKMMFPADMVGWDNLQDKMDTADRRLFKFLGVESPYTWKVLYGQAMVAEPEDSGNCVALFGMWYSLSSHQFFLTKADEVDGLFICSMQDFMRKLFGVEVLPSTLRENIMDYKATGKLEEFLDAISSRADPSERIEPYLRVLLHGADPRNPFIYEKQRENLVYFLMLLQEWKSLVWKSRGEDGDEAFWKNTMSTMQSVGTMHEDEEADGYEASDLEIYITSAAGGAWLDQRTNATIKARQMQEILQVESESGDQFYFDMVEDMRRSPTLMRVDGRERNALIKSYAKSGLSKGDSAHVRKNMLMDQGHPEGLTKVYRLISRVAQKIVMI